MSSKLRRSNLHPVSDTPPGNNRSAREEIELLKEKTIQLTAQNPQKAAKILSNWVNTSALGGKKNQQKKAA
jgi:hypothetical protein